MIFMFMRRGKPVQRKKRERDTAIYWGDELLAQVMPGTRGRRFCVVHGDLLQGAVRGVYGISTLEDCAEYVLKARGVTDEATDLFTQSEMNDLAVSGAFRTFFAKVEEFEWSHQRLLDELQKTQQMYYDKFRASRDARCGEDSE